MVETVNRPIHEMASTFSICSQPQLASSQKKAAKNALARRRLSPPIERSV
jgi:hypothetical protein